MLSHQLGFKWSAIATLLNVKYLTLLRWKENEGFRDSGEDCDDVELCNLIREHMEFHPDLGANSIESFIKIDLNINATRSGRRRRDKVVYGFYISHILEYVVITTID